MDRIAASVEEHGGNDRERNELDRLIRSANRLPNRRMARGLALRAEGPKEVIDVNTLSPNPARARKEAQSEGPVPMTPDAAADAWARRTRARGNEGKAGTPCSFGPMSSAWPGS